MATGTAYGVNNTVLQSPSPSTILEYGKVEGKLAVTMDKVTAAAQYDDGSIFVMGAKIPKGAIPLFGIMRFTGKSTATLKIGSSGNDDLWGSCSAIATTPTQVFFPTASNTALTADTQIQILTAAAAVVTSEVLEVVLVYAKA